VALSRVVQAHAAVVAVAHEAARAGALGASPADAVRRSLDRAQQVAAGLALDRDRLDVAADVSGYARRRGRVLASATYEVSLGDLPLVGRAPSVSVRAEHVEWLDSYRGGLPGALEDAD
jgi:hypothetical protein